MRTAANRRRQPPPASTRHAAGSTHLLERLQLRPPVRLLHRRQHLCGLGLDAGADSGGQRRGNAPQALGGGGGARGGGLARRLRCWVAAAGCCCIIVLSRPAGSMDQRIITNTLQQLMHTGGGGSGRAGSSLCGLALLPLGRILVLILVVLRCAGRVAGSAAADGGSSCSRRALEAVGYRSDAWPDLWARGQRLCELRQPRKHGRGVLKHSGRQGLGSQLICEAHEHSR